MLDAKSVLMWLALLAATDLEWKNNNKKKTVKTTQNHMDFSSS